MKNLFKLLAVVLCLCFSLPVFAKEKINNFEVHFDLHEDNSATVKEYITFTAEHNQIKHGLYRILPKDIKIENIKRPLVKIEDEIIRHDSVKLGIEILNILTR